MQRKRGLLGCHCESPLSSSVLIFYFNTEKKYIWPGWQAGIMTGHSAEKIELLNVSSVILDVGDWEKLGTWWL